MQGSKTFRQTSVTESNSPNRLRRRYKVTVFEYPKLQRADTELEFPAYTSLPKKRVEDTRRITAVEGTEVTLFCNLNKPVERARLVDELGETLELESTADDPTVFAVSETLTESRRYELILTDSDGRMNREPPHVVFNVTPNQEPEVKITMPAKDMRCLANRRAPDEGQLMGMTLDSKPTASTTRYRASPPGSCPLANRRQRTNAGKSTILLPLRTWRQSPTSYWRTTSGLRISVPTESHGGQWAICISLKWRHFEEIFRQGEQPPSGLSEEEQQQSGQNARQAEELAELQKQII